MLTLPVPLHRARLMSFWLVLCVVGALLFGGIAWRYFSPGWAAVTVGILLGCAIIGLWSPRLIFRPYRLWNKLAAILAYYLRLWLMGICFYLVFVAVGQTGSSFPLRASRTGPSCWVKRAPPASCAPDRWAGHTIEVFPRQSWGRDFYTWTMQTGNWWALCLLPCLFLIALLESEEEESAFPASMYTLF
jgi:hypothetical protein